MGEELETQTLVTSGTPQVSPDKSQVTEAPSGWTRQLPKNVKQRVKKCQEHHSIPNALQYTRTLFLVFCALPTV